MRSISWIKLLLVIAICFTGITTNAQIVKEDKYPNDGGTNCEPYISGFLTPNPPNPSPNSDYVLEMSFDIGGFGNLDYIKEIFFAIDIKDVGTPKPYVLDYGCCVALDHGEGDDEVGYDYYFRFLKPSDMDNDSNDCGDDSFVVSDCAGGGLSTSLTGPIGDQVLNYNDNGGNDPVGAGCPGVEIDILGYGGGLQGNCNIHRLKVVGGYFKTMTGQVYPITKLYGDQVCVGNCSFASACNVITFKETELEPEVKVFPNPVRDELTVELIDLKEADVKVFNINGELVDSQLGVNKDELLLDVSQYSQGVYFIVVQDENGSYQKKFTKL